jgi:hypothetical protein
MLGEAAPFRNDAEGDEPGEAAAEAGVGGAAVELV